MEVIFIPLSPPLGLLRAAGLVRQAAVLEAEDFCVVGLDLAELVHELELVDADVAGAVPGRQVLAVGADADAADLEKTQQMLFRALQNNNKAINLLIDLTSKYIFLN